MRGMSILTELIDKCVLNSSSIIRMNWISNIVNVDMLSTPFSNSFWKLNYSFLIDLLIFIQKWSDTHERSYFIYTIAFRRLTCWRIQLANIRLYMQTVSTVMTTKIYSLYTIDGVKRNLTNRIQFSKLSIWTRLVWWTRFCISWSANYINLSVPDMV